MSELGPVVGAVADAVAEVLGVVRESDPVPTAEAEMQRLARVAAETAETAVRPVSMPAPVQRSYEHLNTGQKLELVLSRLDHLEQLAVMLHSKVDRVGLNTVNLSKNNQHIAAMLQALVSAMTEPEQPESLIQTVRGGF